MGMRNGLVAIVVAVVAVLGLLKAVGAVAGMWLMFRESGFPRWIQVPAGVTLAGLFWMLGKRYRRGRFDFYAEVLSKA